MSKDVSRSMDAEVRKWDFFQEVLLCEHSLLGGRQDPHGLNAHLPFVSACEWDIDYGQELEGDGAQGNTW